MQCVIPILTRSRKFASLKSAPALFDQHPVPAPSRSPAHPPAASNFYLCSRSAYYAALRPRRGRILRRTLSVRICLSARLSVRLSVRPVIISVTSRHLANYNETHVLFGMHRGPHLVRPSRPHNLLYTH